MSGCGKKGGAATETADGKIAISVMISGADAAEATLMQNYVLVTLQLLKLRKI